MIVAISRFRLSREEADRIQGRFQDRSRRVDTHVGFLGLEVLRSPGEQPEFLLVTRWESREALKGYLKSEDFRRVQSLGGSLDAEFTWYEVVA
jgi:heme-degrading monooxygenase HmoA